MHERLPQLNLPKADLRLSRSAGKIYVWDIIRRKHLLLTPEEWVRQHFLHFLLGRNYPQGSIATESGLYVNQQLRRTDILVYRNREPALLVECKAPQVKINQEVFDQASRYNLELMTRHVVITNGLENYVARIDKRLRAYEILGDLPSYEEL